MIVLGEQQRYFAIHIHVFLLLQTPLPSRLPHIIEQNSLCYTVGPCWSFFPFRYQMTRYPLIFFKISYHLILSGMNTRSSSLDFTATYILLESPLGQVNLWISSVLSLKPMGCKSLEVPFTWDSPPEHINSQAVNSGSDFMFLLAPLPQFHRWMKWGPWWEKDLFKGALSQGDCSMVFRVRTGVKSWIYHYLFA